MKKLLLSLLRPFKTLFVSLSWPRLILDALMVGLFFYLFDFFVAPYAADCPEPFAYGFLAAAMLFFIGFSVRDAALVLIDKIKLFRKDVTQFKDPGAGSCG